MRDCRKVKDYWQAPVTITLKDGTRFVAPPVSRYGGFRGGAAPRPAASDPLAALPAALLVEQLSPDRPPSVIVDHTDDVRGALAKADRGGVEPEWPTPSRGQGPWGLAAVALGFITLGWRRFRR